MSKGNFHKKLYREDKFARDYLCKHTRLGYLRNDKKKEEKITREYTKRLLKKEEAEYYNDKEI